MAVTKAILEKWMVAQKRHRLSDKQVQMARELGLNPDKLGKIDNHRQESWKAPLPQFIESIYFKRFKREEPETVKPLKQIMGKWKPRKSCKKRKRRNGENSVRSLPILRNRHRAWNEAQSESRRLSDCAFPFYTDRPISAISSFHKD